MKYAMVFNSELCIGCQSCSVACRSENEVPEGLYRLKVKIQGPKGIFPNLSFDFERFSCQMCENTRYSVSYFCFLYGRKWHCGYRR